VFFSLSCAIIRILLENGMRNRSVPVFFGLKAIIYAKPLAFSGNALRADSRYLIFFLLKDHPKFKG